MSEWWNGRHVRFRCVWRNLCGFKSHLRHHKKDDDFCYHLFYLKNDEGFNPFLWVQCEQAETGVFLL